MSDVVVSHDTGVDAGVDATDSGHDVVLDVKVDAQDSGPDVAVDARPEAVAFPLAVATAYCTKVASCCGETASQFSIPLCAKALTDAPSLVPSQLALVLRGLNSTEYAFDPQQAAKCLSAIEALGCGSPSAATWQGIAAECTGAYTGLLDAGAKGCLSSFDCVTGNYCAPVDPFGNTIVPDGGGTCTPLATVGKPCVDTLNSSDCTYRGLGKEQLYCNDVIGDAGQKSDGGVCAASLPVGAACNYPGYAQECISVQCLPTVDAGFLVYDYACAGNAGVIQIAGEPQCLLYQPDGG